MAIDTSKIQHRSDCAELYENLNKTVDSYEIGRNEFQIKHDAIECEWQIAEARRLGARAFHHNKYHRIPLRGGKE